MRRELITFTIASVLLVLSSGTYAALYIVDYLDSRPAPAIIPEPSTPKPTETKEPTPVAPAPDSSSATPTRPSITPTPTKTPTISPLIPRQKQGYPDLMTEGVTLMQGGYYDLAIPYFETASRLMPKSALPYQKLAESHLALLDTKKALSAAEHAANAEDADAATVLILKTRIHLLDGDFEQARETLALLATDQSIDAVFYRGVLASFYDDRAAAEPLLESLSQTSRSKDAASILAAYREHALYPDAPKTMLDALLAKAYADFHEYRLSYEKILPVITADPAYRDAWIIKGYSEYALKKYGDSVTSLETAYQLDTSKPETQYFLALAYRATEKTEKAIDMLQKALKNGYSEPLTATAALADLYYQNGQYPEAAGAYEQLMREGLLKPADYTRPIYAYLEKASDGQSAWRLAADALARYPGDPEALNLAGWVSIANGYLPEGKNYLEQAIRKDTSKPAPFLNLGKYFEATKDLERAKKSYKRAYDLDPTGSIGTLAGEAYNRLLKD